ncbi:heavy-metal-associated domain-containing protein [Sphingosinicella sp. LHD-64]|uniref:heavy-metal-associated domain-containing protein n=1 Tax=Sphingosinicella sp. LHD-64 TaxID=3072139 RepID=UPI0028103EFA|nr:heavy-metal-associated domain-containing protein [Sphingosinicella sp. LHD-64]MDQ8754962.1 heavy-metal-associated domain-containing protein [Sphingosinicella sp. LHD-64]
MKRLRRLPWFAIPVGAAALLAGAGLIYAQLDGSERGIPPIDSTSNFEVTGIDIDVTARTGEEARVEGWRRAQRDGWRMLWSRTTGRPAAQAPNLPDSVLNSIVSGVVIDSEQIGPTRYIARLGVLFDRARTGQMLGVQGLVRRSAPVLVIPVLKTGSTAYSFEFQNPWQRAWAQFRTVNSPIDYVRTSGTGMDPLLLNLAQARRRGRGWWRMILDQYGAADIVVAELELRRLYPGGPALGIFTARFGPDGQVLGRFQLRADGSAQIGAMLDEGVRRLDMIYTQALNRGLLRPDPSLVIIAPEVQQEIAEVVEELPELAPVQTAPTGALQSFSIQVDTPDAASVQNAELSVSRVGGVASAITTSLALGGTSIMRVTYSGDAAALQAALSAQGWRVQVLGGNTLRITR